MPPVPEPIFAPGSGWYRPGLAAPGSAGDRAAMHAAALPCTVVVLRRRGVRLTAKQLMDRGEGLTGFLVCQDRFTHPHWHACLFRDKEMMTELLPRLLQVQLVRENDGVRLFQGIQVEERVEYRQTWLCAPDQRRARHIVLEMLHREGEG